MYLLRVDLYTKAAVARYVQLWLCTALTLCRGGVSRTVAYARLEPVATSTASFSLVICNKSKLSYVTNNVAVVFHVCGEQWSKVRCVCLLGAKETQVWRSCDFREEAATVPFIGDLEHMESLR